MTISEFLQKGMLVETADQIEMFGNGPGWNRPSRLFRRRQRRGLELIGRLICVGWRTPRRGRASFLSPMCRHSELAEPHFKTLGQILSKSGHLGLGRMLSLRVQGVRFALHEFGCGYTSIGPLREFGFDRMKIDRSLVVAVADPKGAKILNATISLADALRISVTAEGVETESQAAALASAGCDQL